MSTEGGTLPSSCPILQVLDMSTLVEAADVNPVIKFLQLVWQVLEYRIYICLVTKVGNIEHLLVRTETWGVSPSVDKLPFRVTIPATVPQRSEIPEGLMNCPVLYLVNIIYSFFLCDFFVVNFVTSHASFFAFFLRCSSYLFNSFILSIIICSFHL